MSQRIKFGGDRSICCRDMAVFRFFNMEAVRNLGFVFTYVYACHIRSEP